MGLARALLFNDLAMMHIDPTMIEEAIPALSSRIAPWSFIQTSVGLACLYMVHPHAVVHIISFFAPLMGVNLMMSRPVAVVSEGILELSKSKVEALCKTLDELIQGESSAKSAMNEKNFWAD